jgi:hypothetical protein
MGKTSTTWTAHTRILPDWRIFGLPIETGVGYLSKILRALMPNQTFRSGNCEQNKDPYCNTGKGKDLPVIN